MDKFLLLWVLLLPGALCALPNNFQILGYNLTLTITSNLTADVDGIAIIRLRCTTNTKNILLNWGPSLTYMDMFVTYADTDETTPTTTIPSTDLSQSVNATTQQWNITYIKADTNFVAGTFYNVTATFLTKLNDDNKGLFYRQYPIENNQINAVIMTNLRPSFAREVFPCLDEPQLPGFFQLNLTYPNTWGVGATVAVEKSAAGQLAGTTTVLFNSFNTSTNNLAFFLTTNMSTTNYPVAGMTLTFWARKGLDTTTLSANAKFLSDIFNVVQYTLSFKLKISQLNIVMVPGLEEPFSSYGVIFIREENYAKDYTSPQVEGLLKSTVVPIIYQFIRQYSEFSTRPAQWADYWVSQAIGKYLEFVILNTVLPTFDFKTDLEVVTRQKALYLDAQPGAKPLKDDSDIYNSSSSIQALVDDPLKGLKGAAILNMLDQSLPAGTVFDTIKAFLNTNTETPVSSANFISAIQAIGNNPLLSSNARLSLTYTLNSWISFTSYPLETVKINKYTSQAIGSVNFTTTGYCFVFNTTCKDTLQPNFYLSTTVSSKSDLRYYYPRQEIWANNVDSDSRITTSIDVKNTDWIVANMNSGGYYRSNYDTSNWELIITSLSSKDNLIMGRSQLLDDAFALALSRSNPLNYGITIRLANANLGNTQYKNWVPVQRGLKEIGDNLMGLSEYTSYKNFAAGYFLNLNRFLQNSSYDVFEMARIQGLFLDDMCEYDITGYRTSAIGNLTDLLRGSFPSSVPSSTYDGIACCGARYNSTLKAQTLWGILSDYKYNYYSRRYASIALGCLSNYTDVVQYFDTMTEANSRLKHYIQITLENLAEKNPFAFLSNFTQRINKFQSKLGSVSVASLITTAGRKINNNTQASVLDSVTNADAVVVEAVQTTRSLISNRVSWLSTNNKTQLVEALQTNTLPSGSGANLLTAMTLLMFLPYLMNMLAPVRV